MEEKIIAQRLADGEFIVSVQIDPPGNKDVEQFQEVIKKLKRLGVKVVDVNSSRRISHDSIHLSVALSKKFSVIPHITTRDSSLNGLVNQIFAAHSWSDIRDFLIITGDPYESSRKAIVPNEGIFQKDSVGALEIFTTYLRKKMCLNISFAAAINQYGNRRDEANRLEQKEEIGVDFFMSQPVFSKSQIDALENLCYRHVAKPVMVGIWPLIHERTINAIEQGRIEGVKMADETYQEALRYMDDIDALQMWGLKHAQDVIEYCRTKNFNGVYIVAPARDPLALAPLLKKIL